MEGIGYLNLQEQVSKAAAKLRDIGEPSVEEIMAAKNAEQLDMMLASLTKILTDLLIREGNNASALEIQEAKERELYYGVIRDSEHTTRDLRESEAETSLPIKAAKMDRLFLSAAAKSYTKLIQVLQLKVNLCVERKRTLGV